MFGAGGGTNSYREVEETDVVLLWGSNAREAHPIFFQHVLKAIHNGARVYGVDVKARLNAIPDDYVSRLKEKYRAEGPRPSNTQYGWVQRAG